MICLECKVDAKIKASKREGKTLIRVRICPDCMAPFRTFEPARCPNCGSDETTIHGNTERISESTTSRYRVCSRCLQTFRACEVREEEPHVVPL